MSNGMKVFLVLAGAAVAAYFVYRATPITLGATSAAPPTSSGSTPTGSTYVPGQMNQPNSNDPAAVPADLNSGTIAGGANIDGTNVPI